MLSLQMAEALLSHGCVVNACDKKDRRALHWAAHMGYKDVVRLLINHAADVNVRDRDVSAISLCLLADLINTRSRQVLHLPG
jgi:ankyrin repeat protein